MNDAERFFRHVKKTDSCWNWIASVDIGGYGRFWFNGKTIRAHHFLVLGDKPKGMLALHRCDNRRCVNPAHIFFGTSKDNFSDMLLKGRGNQKPGWISMMKVRRLRFGEKNHKSKLRLKDVIAIRSTPKSFGYMAELAKKYSVSHQSIRKVIHHESWKEMAERDNLTELPK